MNQPFVALRNKVIIEVFLQKIFKIAPTKHCLALAIASKETKILYSPNRATSGQRKDMKPLLNSLKAYQGLQ